MNKARRRIRIADSVITSELPADAYVNLLIYNLLRRRVVTLVEGKQVTGYRSVLWEASRFQSGLCFYKLTAQDGAGNQVFSDVKKMLLVK
jgi:hypothetical protein